MKYQDQQELFDALMDEEISSIKQRLEYLELDFKLVVFRFNQLTK